MSVARVTHTPEEIEPELIASGRLHLIGLDAVRERMGDRWSRRREQVWAHAERVADRMLEPGDVFRRVSEVEYLLGFGAVSPRVARAHSLRVLDEILTHFLGEAPPAAIRIGVVLSLDEKDLRWDRVPEEDIGGLLREAAEAPAEPEPSPARAGFETWRRHPLRLSTGRRLDLVSWVEPLQHVRMEESVGMRFVRELAGVAPPMRDRLEPAELAELDLATLGHVREGLADWGDRPGFILAPLSFTAFANAATRLRLTGRLADLALEARGRLILEVEDLGDAVPSSRVVETVGYMRPYARGVVVRASPVRAGLERLRAAGVLGVALDAAGLDGRPGEVFGRLKLLAERSQGIAPEVFALGLPTPEMAAVVTAASAGFYSARPSAPKLGAQATAA